LPTRLDFFIKLKYESSTIIQSVGNKYSLLVNEIIFIRQIKVSATHYNIIRWY